MSLAQIPKRDFGEIITYLNIYHGLDFTVNEGNGLTYTDCNSDTFDKLPDLQLTIYKSSKSKQSKVFSIPPSSYLINTHFYSNNYLLGLQPL